ncbi:site-specific DNA-methyltransferase [Candidatus Poribacteria bacterium]|nr:site-specific DNA-methyltransferase [Candidatus Poribacteria bacterium]
MARKKTNNQKPLEQYDHRDKERLNNPQVGLVKDSTDNEYGQNKKTYRYDPHLEPQLQWAGKAEHTRFEVPTVSLHVHERIDPKTIIETVQKEKDDGGQMSLFEEKKPLREAIEFYKHNDNWSNRLIAGDSLLVMNSLLEKEGMAGKVQMIYFDPPYGIKYGSNFQPFVNKRDVKDGKDEDLTAEPEMIKAFRDTWELGIHSYLTYLRDRLLLARELLHESGSGFVQISDENVHRVRDLMDEIFGQDNFIVTIIFTKTGSKESGTIDPINDYLVWYSKDKKKVKLRKLFESRTTEDLRADGFKYWVDGELRKDIPDDFDTQLVVRGDPITSDGFRPTTTVEVDFDGNKYFPGSKNHWKTSVEGLNKLNQQGRLLKGTSLQYLRMLSDFPVKNFTNVWSDLGGASNMVYVVQTSTKAIQRCLLMTTDPGDLVLDITCGSGTTAFVAEQWGRRWITCDTSRVAIALAKQRLMTANFDYYELAQPNEGVGSGFKYKTVPHITLKSIANNEPAAQETLYDQPFIDRKRTRVTGPFTVESVPAPVAKTFDELDSSTPLGMTGGADISIARSGETLRQAEWRDELLRAGVRAKGGAFIHFTRVEPLSGTRYIQAQAETRAEKPQKVLVVFGPEHAPLEQRTVELAMEEAYYLKPAILLFCAFQFDDEAAKDIDETPEHLVGFKLLKAQMNIDLQTEDLKKKRNTNESFWLVGQPDVVVRKIAKGEDKGKTQVEVMGFDYYNPKTGNVESGGKGNIAMWMLDTDYDGRSIFPSQVFFPMAGAQEGWSKLAKNLRAEIDEEKIEAFAGTVSLPFEPGKAIAVKIIDDRGIESLRVIKL